MAGGNHKIRKLVREHEGLCKLSSGPFLSCSSLETFYFLYLLPLCREIDREGLLEGHFGQLSFNSTILRGDHYTP